MMSDEHPANEAMEPGNAKAPPAVRLAFRAALGLLAAGAFYLIAVRHEAILIDLANFTAWCF